MTTTTKRTTNPIRYIDIDWGDERHNTPIWRLKVDGRTVATAPVADWTRPPFALTEGLNFTPQYHSSTAAMSGEPDSWIYRPAPPRRHTDPFWIAMAVVGILAAASARWPAPALAATVVLVGVVAVQEARP